MTQAENIDAVPVLALGRLSGVDSGFAGVKGANLGELLFAGLPVPPGFVVGTPALAALLDQGGLRKRLESLLREADLADAQAAARVASRARALVLDQPLPAATNEQVREAYFELTAATAEHTVAVRSSPSRLDPPSASFAGMGDTFLGVRGGDQLLRAVQGCLASVFAPRSVAYRARQRIDPSEARMAVVVQQQLPATSAGVLWTLDPTSGSLARVVVEATFGLGSAVVSGSVRPDRHVVDKHTLSVLSREVHPKEVAIEATPEGGTFVRGLPPAEASKAALTDAQTIELAQLGCRIERHYGAPQEVEWLLTANGRASILQSRSVSAAGVSPEIDPVPTSVLVRGFPAAPGTRRGRVAMPPSPTADEAMRDGDVLVLDATTPEWDGLIARSAGVITELGGMAAHAAVVARALGLPCVTAPAGATRRLRAGQPVVVDGTHGYVIRAPGR